MGSSLVLKQDQMPHFFKIVFSDSISHHKLAIPRKFVQMYGDVVSSPVTLRVPISGSKWKVEIVRSEGEIWLQKGWREFAKYYSVVEGSFLVFEYQKRDSEFNVIIFDKTASEIDYPVVDLDQQQGEIGRQRVTKAVHKEPSNVQSENPSFKIIMQPSLLYNRRALVIPPSFARNYLNKNDVAVLKVLDGRTWFVNYYSRNIFGVTKTRIERFGWKKFVKDNHLEVGDVCVFELIDHIQTTFRVAISKFRQQANLGKVEESIEKESRSIGRNLSFSNRCEAKEAAKKNTSVNPSFQATISSACLRSRVVCVPASFIKNMKQETKYAKLKVNNRCWTVKLIIHPKFRSGHLSAGWSEFARENSLKAGDVCIFELINSNDQTLLINLSIVRDSGRCSVSNGADVEVQLQVPKVEETTFEIPDEDFGQFSSSRKRKEKSTLSSSLPSKKMKNVVKTGKEVKKEDEGLAYRKNMVNKVLTKKKPHLTLQENTLDENPTFQIAIGRSHVCRKWSMPDIPAGFARKYMKSNDARVVLNVLDGKTWSVKYCRRQVCGQTRTKFMRSDWKKFVQGNRLQVDDTCTFELIDPDNRIFRVIISKGREATNLGKSKHSMRKESGAIECICLGNPSLSNPPEAEW